MASIDISLTPQNPVAYNQTREPDLTTEITYAPALVNVSPAGGGASVEIEMRGYSVPMVPSDTGVAFVVR